MAYPALGDFQPTSSLDSSSPHVVVGCLCAVAAARGTTVVLSIHQPSSRLLSAVDFLLLSEYEPVPNAGRDMVTGLPHDALVHRPSATAPPPPPPRLLSRRARPPSLSLRARRRTHPPSLSRRAAAAASPPQPPRSLQKKTITNAGRFAKENNHQRRGDRSPPVNKLGEKEEVTEEIVMASLRRALDEFSSLQADDGHWPCDLSGVTFIMPILCVAHMLQQDFN
uniref:Squalene cyclase N-terminal domain-containing protein n=1 Tax=Oryza meridionalis TaxID=40149 RepID=A0A0E0CFD2_9ORYZ